MTNIIKLIPTIIAVVQCAEDMLPEGSGKEKLSFALDTVANIYAAVGESMPNITSLIATVVNALHALGVFKRKAPKPPVVTLDTASF